jgi:hypothetical protein
MYLSDLSTFVTDTEAVTDLDTTQSPQISSFKLCTSSDAVTGSL